MSVPVDRLLMLVVIALIALSAIAMRPKENKNYYWSLGISGLVIVMGVYNLLVKNDAKSPITILVLVVIGAALFYVLGFNHGEGEVRYKAQPQDSKKEE